MNTFFTNKIAYYGSFVPVPYIKAVGIEAYNLFQEGHTSLLTGCNSILQGIIRKAELTSLSEYSLIIIQQTTVQEQAAADLLEHFNLPVLRVVVPNNNNQYAFEYYLKSLEGMVAKLSNFNDIDLFILKKEFAMKKSLPDRKVKIAVIGDILTNSIYENLSQYGEILAMTDEGLFSQIVIENSENYLLDFAKQKFINPPCVFAYSMQTRLEWFKKINADVYIYTFDKNSEIYELEYSYIRAKLGKPIFRYSKDKLDSIFYEVKK